jgi:hypothetical protein
LTLTDTTTKIHELGNGGSIGKGRGKAVAIGSDPLAVVTVDGSGDKVITHTKEHYFPHKNIMVAKGFVVVIDRPAASNCVDETLNGLNCPIFDCN